jgi:tetratricopeptide (TPR) repeat protein
MRYTVLFVFIVAGSVAFVETFSPPQATWAQVAPSTKSAPTFAQRRIALENQLNSPSKAVVDQAFAAYKAWFSEDPKVAENAFWYARPNMTPLVDHASQTLELIELSKQWKFANDPKNYGYLFALQCESLMQLGRSKEALAALQEGLDREPYSAGDELRKTLVPALSPQKKQKEIVDILGMAIAYCPDDAGIVEDCLKQRIAALNALKQYDAALADCKSLFNVSTLAHTAEAITLLDRQLLLPNMNDRTKVDAFRKEQTAGATPTLVGQPGRTSPVVLTIKVDATPYDASLKNMPDDSLRALNRHAKLLLIADKPTEALAIAQQALAQAVDAKDISAANELIARCYKAQDGTIGRANAWIAANPQAK